MSDELSVDAGTMVGAAGVRLLKNQCSHGSTIGSLRPACEPPIWVGEGCPRVLQSSVAGVTIRPEQVAESRPKAAWRKKIT